MSHLEHRVAGGASLVPLLTVSEQDSVRVSVREQARELSPDEVAERREIELDCFRVFRHDGTDREVREAARAYIAAAVFVQASRNVTHA